MKPSLSLHVSTMLLERQTSSPSPSLHVHVLSLSHIWLSVTPWTEAPQLLCPWDFPGKNTGVGCHFLLQGISPTQGLNPCLPTLAGRFFTTDPPKNSIAWLILISQFPWSLSAIQTAHSSTFRLQDKKEKLEDIFTKDSYRINGMVLNIFVC